MRDVRPAAVVFEDRVRGIEREVLEARRARAGKRTEIRARARLSSWQALIRGRTTGGDHDATDDNCLTPEHGERSVAGAVEHLHPGGEI
jgi:hypothetical protein